jgi:hypothetical protein
MWLSEFLKISQAVGRGLLGWEIFLWNLKNALLSFYVVFFGQAGLFVHSRFTGLLYRPVLHV